jgi:hypothetical protein
MLVRGLQALINTWWDLDEDSRNNGSISSDEFPNLNINPRQWLQLYKQLRHDRTITLEQAKARLQELTREVVNRNLHSPEPKSRENNPYSTDNPNRISFLEWLELEELKPRLYWE